jgi:hypothetical protein
MVKRQTNFDLYLVEQLNNPGFADRFKKAGEAWEAALRSGVGRKTSRLRRLVPTEAELARRERRPYEPASVLLARIQAEREGKGAPK